MLEIATLSTLAGETAMAYPDVYRAINAERNVTWAGRIREPLTSDEVEFLSIGIDYLVGPA